MVTNRRSKECEDERVSVGVSVSASANVRVNQLSVAAFGPHLTAPFQLLILLKHPPSHSIIHCLVIERDGASHNEYLQCIYTTQHRTVLCPTRHVSVTRLRAPLLHTTCQLTVR